jgi:hypothetical protein
MKLGVYKKIAACSFPMTALRLFCFSKQLASGILLRVVTKKSNQIATRFIIITISEARFTPSF